MDGAGFLRHASALGVRLVQVADNLPVDRMTEKELAEFVHLAEDLGITVELGTRGITTDHLRNYLRLCDRLRCGLLRVVIDTPDHKPAPAEIVELLGCALPALEGQGVTLAIENHDRFSSGVLADIVRQVDSNRVGICLDTVNSFGALEGPEVVIGNLLRFVVSLHLKDFLVRRADHMMGFVIEGVPAGKGQLDVPNLLRRMAEQNRDPNVILELWPALEATVEQTIEKEQRWVAESVEYLKGLISGKAGTEYRISNVE